MPGLPWKPCSRTVGIAKGPRKNVKFVLPVSFRDRCFENMKTKIIWGDSKRYLFIWGKGNSCWCFYTSHKLRMLSQIHSSEGHVNPWYSLPAFLKLGTGGSWVPAELPMDPEGGEAGKCLEVYLPTSPRTALLSSIIYWNSAYKVFSFIKLVDCF